MNRKVEIEMILKNSKMDYRIVTGNFMISCPFHDDVHPSFGIRFDGVWNCFSCGKSGVWRDLESVFDFRSNIFSFADLVLERLKESSSPSFHSIALPHDFREYDENIPLKILERISGQMIKKFGIGEAKTTYPGYFIIPIKIESYESFACRYLIKNPITSKRWLFPRDFRKVIFPSPIDGVILTEGLIDMMAVWNFGFSASCCFGHYIDDFQLFQIALSETEEITLLFDSYESHFMDSLKKAFSKLNGTLCVFAMKLEKDPDEISKKEFLDAFEKRVDLSSALEELQIRNFRSEIMDKLS